MFCCGNFPKKCVYFQDLYQQSPEKFATPDIRGLLEFEWNLYLEEERKAQKGEVWAFNDKAMAYLNGQLLGEFIVLNHLSSKRAGGGGGIQHVWYYYPNTLDQSEA